MQTLSTPKQLKYIIKPYFFRWENWGFGVKYLSQGHSENVGAKIQIQASDFKAYAIKPDIKFYAFTCKCLSGKNPFSRNVYFHQISPRHTQRPWSSGYCP